MSALLNHDFSYKSAYIVQYMFLRQYTLGPHADIFIQLEYSHQADELEYNGYERYS